MQESPTGYPDEQTVQGESFLQAASLALHIEHAATSAGAAVALDDSTRQVLDHAAFESHLGMYSDSFLQPAGDLRRRRGRGGGARRSAQETDVLLPHAREATTVVVFDVVHSLLIAREHAALHCSGIVLRLLRPVGEDHLPLLQVHTQELPDTQWRLLLHAITCTGIGGVDQLRSASHTAGEVHILVQLLHHEWRRAGEKRIEARHRR